MTLILISWVVFSGMVYLGFSAFEKASSLVADVTGGQTDRSLDAIAPAAGEPAPAP